MDPLNPTNQSWELFDPLEYAPPIGKSLLLINKGGVLMIGHWTPDAIAWGYKPKIPKSVKERIYGKGA